MSIFDQVSEVVKAENSEIDHVSSFDPAMISFDQDEKPVSVAAGPLEESTHPNVFSEMATVFESERPPSSVESDASESLPAPILEKPKEEQESPRPLELQEKKKHVAMVGQPLWNEEISFDDFLIKEPESQISEKIPELNLEDSLKEKQASENFRDQSSELPKIDLGQLVQDIEEVVKEPKSSANGMSFEMKKIEV